MNDQEHQDQLDQPTSDQLDAGHRDQLDQGAGDQLDQLAGEQQTTTGDQETAPAFADAPETADQDDVDQDVQVTQPHPYAGGFGVTGKFGSEAAPHQADVFQDTMPENPA